MIWYQASLWPITKYELELMIRLFKQYIEECGCDLQTEVKHCLVCCSTLLSRETRQLVQQHLRLITHSHG